MKKSFAAFELAALLALGLLAAIYGLGSSYPSFITPISSHRGEFKLIHGDGWLEDGAVVSFRDLAQRGNRLEFKFNTLAAAWSTAGDIRRKRLWGAFGKWLVNSTDPYVVYLSGSCEPREVAFKVENPFVASEKDQRKLGVQVKSVEVVSKLGPPILRLDQLAACCVMVIGLALLFWYAAQPSCFRWAAFLVPIGSAALLSHAIFPRLEELTALWSLMALGLLGVILAQKFERRTARAGSSYEAEWVAPGISALLVFLIIALGGALRFYGLDFGLPANYHPDEVPKVNAVMRMVEHGDLNPRYFLHPSLLLYCTYFTNKLFHFFGMTGEFRDTAFFAGRTVSALAGTASLYLVYVIGSRLATRATGLMAAAFLAVYPLHVTCSRYLKEDALLLFFVLACAAVMLKAVKEDKKWYLILAALLAGFSASVKYSGLLTFAIVAMAPWLRSRKIMPDRNYLAWTIAAGFVFPLGFLICTPYSILNSSKFLKDFASEQHHMSRGHTISIDAWSQFWMYHYSRSVIPGITLLGSLIAACGVGFLLWRRRVEDLIIVALILLYYLPAEWVKAKPAPQPERYILPCLPFLAIAAGELLRALRSMGAKSVAYILLILALVAPSLRSVELASEIEDDTRTQMANWMKQNLPHSSKVYLDWKPYAPRFWQDEFQISYVPRAKIIPMLYIEALKESGQDYLVLSSLFYERYFSQPKSNPAIRERLRQVFERVPVVKEFKPKYGTYGFHNPTVTLFSLKEADFAALEEQLRKKSAGEIEATSNDMRASFKW